jgi:cobalt/nickel transport system permease protein
MKNFAEKTILDIQTIFSDLFYSEETTRKKGLLQLLDPRVKILSFLGLIVTSNLFRTISALTVMIGYILILAVCSRIPVIRYLRRVLVMSVLFTGVVVLPSLFNLVTPGDPLWQLSKHLYITKQGSYGASLMVLRSFTSISLIYLLTATTKWAELLKSLKAIKIPSPFVATLEMAHRYIFLGLEMAADLFMARKSRTLGKSKSVSGDGRRFVANTMGNLLIRTTVMGDEVYQAMISRGYTGEIKLVNRFHMRIIDYLWLMLNIVLLLMFKYRLKLL